ncbi:MAG: diaminopimelate decarboxylase [bacterium]
MVDYRSLAREFGTPLFVVDEQILRQNAQRYLTTFRKLHPQTDIAYACKALCVKEVLRVVGDEGCSFDVSSGGEVYTALKAGCDPAKMYFHGNNKSKAELKMALENNVGFFMVDTIQEIINLDEIAKGLSKTAQIIMRVNPGIEAHTHEYIKTGCLDSKFGVPQNEIEQAVKEIKTRKNLNLVGFHAHIGSQIFDVKPFVDETKLLVKLAEKYGVKIISLGGGIGIVYTKADKPPTIKEFAEAITAVVKGKDIKLILEPGRSIVGPAGITIYTVGAIKDIPKIRKYVLIDGGMADNPRPILYQAKYDAFVVGKEDQKPAEEVTIAGRFCESGDVLISDIKLPKIEVNDLLAVSGTGAYNYSMASNYNRVPRPAMVMVNNGQAKVIVRRETYEDLVRNDL